MAQFTYYLDRSKIPDLVQSFAAQESVEVSAPSVKNGGSQHLYEFKRDGKTFVRLNVYFKTGPTTLGSASGNDKVFFETLANYIKDGSEYIVKESRPISLPNVTTAQYDDLIAWLESENCRVENGKRIQNGRQVKVIGEYGDTVVINHYDRGTLLVQGGGNIVKLKVIDVLATFISCHEAINLQLEQVEIDYGVDDLLKECRMLLPVSYDYLGEHLITILSTSVAFRRVDIDLNDYSAFVYPILRALEGYLKTLFRDKGIVIENRKGFKDLFIPGAVHRLNPEIKVTLNDVKRSNGIEEIYNFYFTNRHGLFHVDNVIAITRTIETRNEAVQLIDDTIELIERVHSTILN